MNVLIYCLRNYFPYGIHYQETKGRAFDYLKKHYQFIGILTIVILSIYAIALIFGGIAALAF